MKTELEDAQETLHRHGDQKHVFITADDGSVDQPRVTISVSAGDQVVWSAGSKRSTIVFASSSGSPFHDSIFHVPASGSVASGVAKPGIAYGEFKYSVIGDTAVNDPVVIIQR